MATKKDLVEAYSFSRRRLVTAFVSGAPGGREVEPSRPGRTIIGGIAIAVLVAAGGAVAGILTNHTSVDWSKPGLISEKETGALYVNLPSGDSSAVGSDEETVLLPVVNVTSAMLLLGPQITPTTVPHSEIAERQTGDQVGILQAPTTPPPADALIESGWTACTGDTPGDEHGIKVRVSQSPGVTLDEDAAMLVRVGSRRFVVAEAALGTDPPRAYAYPVPDSTPDALLSDLTGDRAAEAQPVRQDWVDLFPGGGVLGSASFDVHGLGRPYPEAPSLTHEKGHQPKIGDYFYESGDPTHTMRVLTDQGVSRLDAFAAEVYRYSRFPGGKRPRLLPEQDLDPAGQEYAPPVAETSWPSALTRPKQPGEYCAVLDAAAPGARPGAVLATAVAGPATASDVDPGQREALVDTGHGAVVLSSGPSTGAAAAAAPQRFLIDDHGLAYLLDADQNDEQVDARTQLGYGDVPDVVVPDAWIKLFAAGVPLSVDQARCPPTYGLDLADAASDPTKRPGSCSG